MAGRELGFRGAPLRERVFITLACVAAVVLPGALASPLRGSVGRDDLPADWVAAVVLVGVSALNIEIGRVVAGGLARAQQPHKALSAWAFACAAMLPTWWLLVVVPLTYAHARWRGLRVPLWKWIGSGAFLVLAGTASAVVPRATLGGLPHWTAGSGRDGLLTLLASGALFLAVATALFAGTAWLNHAEDEQWLRAQLLSPAYHVNEAGVVLTGGLLAALWTASPWFVLLFVPLYSLLQRAVLIEPLRENAAMAEELVQRNEHLRAISEFQHDLLGMLTHEVGNPLSSVSGYTEVGAEALAAGDLETTELALTVVARNARQIRDVLHDMVAIAETDAGGLVARPQSTRLAPRLEAAATAQPPGAQPEVRCPADLHALVQPGHLDQVLANLLGNAAKYGGGATRLSASLRDGQVVVAVEDDGPGVPPDFRDRIFQRRTRHPDTADAVGGRGLGLHISRALALANGGDLRLAPSSSGSRFELVLRPAEAV